MTATARFFRVLAILLAGSIVTAGAYWALLNVPESNVAALALSALLVFVVLGGIGATLASAACVSTGASIMPALRRSAVTLPLFAFGLAMFGLLWIATGWFDAWWLNHRGEADAVALRYLGFTKTAPVHAAISWLSWLLRWVVGTSIVIAFAVVAATGSAADVWRSVRVGLGLVPLATLTVGVLAVSQGLWRIAQWRPATLPPTSAEIYFSTAKLGMLSLVMLAIAGAVVTTYTRAARRS